MINLKGFIVPGCNLVDINLQNIHKYSNGQHNLFADWIHSSLVRKNPKETSNLSCIC